MQFKTSLRRIVLKSKNCVPNILRDAFFDLPNDFQNWIRSGIKKCRVVEWYRVPIIGPNSCFPLLFPLLFWSRWHDQQCSSIFTLEKVFIFFSTSVAWVAFRSKGLNWGVGVGVGGVIFLGGLQINVATMSGTPHLLSKLNLGVAEHFFNLLRF